MMTKERGATDRLGNPSRPKMALDKKRAINEVFIIRAVTIGRNKEDDNSGVFISRHLLSKALPRQRLNPQFNGPPTTRKREAYIKHIQPKVKGISEKPS